MKACILSHSFLFPSSPASLSCAQLTLDVYGHLATRTPTEMFDLTWLDQLTHLRYLHIKANHHISLATLQSLQLLPLPPPQPPQYIASSATIPSTPAPAVPCFVSPVEEFGLNVHDGLVGVERAGELEFDAWTRLQRCAVQLITRFPIGSGPQRCYINRRCEAADAIIRTRVGAERWVSEEQLVSGRLDSRWRAEAGGGLQKRAPQHSTNEANEPRHSMAQTKKPCGNAV